MREVVLPVWSQNARTKGQADEIGRVRAVTPPVDPKTDELTRLLMLFRAAENSCEWFGGNVREIRV